MLPRLAAPCRNANVMSLIVIVGVLAAGVAPGARAAAFRVAGSDLPSHAVIEKMIQREIARVAAKGAAAVSCVALVPMVVTRFEAEQSRVGGSRAVLAALHRVVHEVVAGRTLRARLRAGTASRAASQSIVVHASTIPSGERQALLDFYTSTNGAGWTTNTGWNGAAGTECGWAGVTCDSGRTTVQRLDLYDNNLLGTFPATFGNLTNLQYLDLAPTSSRARSRQCSSTSRACGTSTSTTTSSRARSRPSSAASSTCSPRPRHQPADRLRSRPRSAASSTWGISTSTPISSPARSRPAWTTSQPGVPRPR